MKDSRHWLCSHLVSEMQMMMNISYDLIMMLLLILLQSLRSVTKLWEAADWLWSKDWRAPASDPLWDTHCCFILTHHQISTTKSHSVWLWRCDGTVRQIMFSDHSHDEVVENRVWLRVLTSCVGSLEAGLHCSPVKPLIFQANKNYTIINEPFVLLHCNPSPFKLLNN